MRVTLFKAFEDTYRQSMTLYSSRLAEVLRKKLSGEDVEVREFLPHGIFLAPAAARYLSQYFLYQFCVPFAAGDINHITDHSYAHLIHSLPERRTVVTFHDAIWLKNDLRPGRTFIKTYNLTGLEKAGAIICDSESSRQALLEKISYPKEKIRVIYPGVDPIFFQPPALNAKNILGLRPGRYLLHAGHTGTYKNIPGVLRLLAAASRSIPDLRLLKCGTPFTADQRALIKDLSLENRIDHLGLVDRNQLPVIYSAADLLVTPSLDEGFGFPLLEAMACQTPVLCSNRGSLPELAPSQLLLFDPSDIAGMTDYCVKILNNQNGLGTELVEAGNLKARNFSWRQTGSQVLALYRELLKQEGSLQ